MRDGVELSADIYRPATSEPRPVVLARTPYNKNTQLAVEKASQMTDAGFAFVWMDVRGRGDSDGSFVPYRNDATDGYDSIEWFAAQEWSTGAVATWGPSYLGWIQWLTALTQPPHLKAMVIYVCPSDPFVDWPGGTQLPAYACWFRMVDGRVLQHVEATDWIAVYQHLPLESMDEAAGFRSEHWRRDVSHAPCDPYWEPLRYQQRLHELDLPALHVTGWYDDCQQASLINFAGMRTTARSESARSGQRLIVGPWDHTLTRNRGRQLGAIDFGEASDFDLEGYEAAWLRHHLLGEPLPDALAAQAQIFVMGRNTWRGEAAWPLERTKWTNLYLSSGGGANTRFGDGVLLPAPPREEEAPDEYVYDPADPVPFLTEPLSSQIGGPDDYAEVETRSDVLVYTSAILEEELEVTGPVRMRLYASSSAPDTDFTAKLVDVHPDGYCQRLCDGMTRARYRTGFQRELALVPGEVTEFDVNLWNIAHAFQVGHRLRLEIASSAFPKYDRNLNTGGPLATSTQMDVARNTVRHTPAYPSHLILPVIPADHAETHTA